MRDGRRASRASRQCRNAGQGIETLTPHMEGHTMSNDLRSYGPGKFDTLIDCYVYACALDTSWLQDFTGDDHGNGWAGLVLGPGREIAAAVQEIAEEDGGTLTPAEFAFLRQHDALIITEDSQGFVSVEYFDLKSQAWREWKHVAADFAVTDEPDDEGEDA